MSRPQPASCCRCKRNPQPAAASSGRCHDLQQQAVLAAHTRFYAAGGGSCARLAGRTTSIRRLAPARSSRRRRWGSSRDPRGRRSCCRRRRARRSCSLMRAGLRVACGAGVAWAACWGGHCETHSADAPAAARRAVTALPRGAPRPHCRAQRTHPPLLTPPAPPLPRGPATAAARDARFADSWSLLRVPAARSCGSGRQSRTKPVPLFSAKVCAGPRLVSGYPRYCGTTSAQ